MTKPLFAITEAELEKQKKIDKEFINSSLFVIPSNDGEALRSIQILTALKAPHLHISKQKWGATLDNELSKLPPDSLKQVKNIVIFEMPGKSCPETSKISSEESLRAQGFKLHIIDHHYYGWLDRYNNQASIEQLCDKIGWQMGETDTAIAVNDRSYIPGLKALGLNKQEILRVRIFDLEAQGNNRSYIDKQLKIARKHIAILQPKKVNDLWILDGDEFKQPYIMQSLAIEDPKGLIHGLEIKSHKIGFSGKPEVAEELRQQDWREWEKTTGQLISYGGGDRKSSQFWGLKGATTNTKITPELVTYVKTIVVKWFQ